LKVKPHTAIFILFKELECSDNLSTISLVNFSF
jgi:hypothetical protein